MLIHCKNNAIHCDINDMCIAWVLIDCKNNAIHCNINDICIAWVLTYMLAAHNHCSLQHIINNVDLASFGHPGLLWDLFWDCFEAETSLSDQMGRVT